MNTEPIQLGTYTASIAVLQQKGLTFSTVIDIGCADGHFFLNHAVRGLLPGATALNIDANPLYEDSLKAIQDAMGGHYFLGAVSDQAGELEMTFSVHPYWSSLRPSGDLYWARVNDLEQSKAKVKTVTLDQLVSGLALKPPYLIKLDVQGAELAALGGAREVLRETDVVICEADIHDFHDIDAALVEAGFGLFDLTYPQWTSDQTLGWFHPVYLNRRKDHIRRRSFWDPALNEQVIKANIERRNGILKQNAAALAQLKTLRGKS